MSVESSVPRPRDSAPKGAVFLSYASQAAEAAGFASVFVTEHPFPEDEWVRSGGHHALDPFVAIAAGEST